MSCTAEGLHKKDLRERPQKVVKSASQSMEGIVLKAFLECVFSKFSGLVQRPPGRAVVPVWSLCRDLVDRNPGTDVATALSSATTGINSSDPLRY